MCQNCSNVKSLPWKCSHWHKHFDQQCDSVIVVLHVTDRRRRNKSQWEPRAVSHWQRLHAEHIRTEAIIKIFYPTSQKLAKLGCWQLTSSHCGYSCFFLTEFIDQIDPILLTQISHIEVFTPDFYLILLSSPIPKPQNSVNEHMECMLN